MQKAHMIAQGEHIWPYLKNYGQFRPTRYIFLGRYETANPFTQYGEEQKGGFLFISEHMAGYSLYYAKNALWTHANNVLFRNGFYLQSMLHAGLKVKWVVPVYKAMIAFGFQIIPYGKYVGRGVKMLSLATFWRAHQKEIDAGIGIALTLLDDLRAMYQECPKLTRFMVALAMEEIISDFRQEIRDKGLMEVIASRLDGEKYLETVATFVGASLKVSLAGTGKGTVAGWLTDKGFKRLSSIAGVLHKHRVYSGLLAKGAAVASGPGFKDTHLVPTALAQEFSQAGITVMQNGFDCSAVEKEGCLGSARTVERLDRIAKKSDELHFLMKHLSDQAEYEVF